MDVVDVDMFPSIDTLAGLLAFPPPPLSPLRGMMGIESPLFVRVILLQRGICFGGVDTEDNGILAGPLLSTPPAFVVFVVVESVHLSLGVNIIFLSNVNIVVVVVVCGTVVVNVDVCSWALLQVDLYPLFRCLLTH